MASTSSEMRSPSARSRESPVDATQQMDLPKSSVSRLGMRGEEIPQDVSGRDSGGGIEIGIERSLPGDVHGDGIPCVGAADQLVVPDFCIRRTTTGPFLRDRRDMSLAIA